MLFLLLTLASFARAACLDAGVVSEIRKEIRMQILDPDLCQETRDSHKLLSALAFLKSEPLARVASPLDRGLLPEDAWSFLRTRVQALVNEPTCPLGKLAFVRVHEPGVMHLCPSFYDERFTIVERLPVLLHEAHHFDGDKFSHVHCKQGRLNGMRDACDPSLEYGGGYAVEAEVLARLSRSSLPAPLKARARNMALIRAAENFNQPVAPYKLESVYLSAVDGSGYLLDPSTGNLQAAPTQDLQEVRLVSRGQALAAIPLNGEDAYQIDLLSGIGKLPAEGETLLSYNRLPKKERPEILAILNEDMFSGVVKNRRLSVAYGDNPYETEVGLPFDARAVYTPGEFGSSHKDTLYVESVGGDIHPIRFKPGRVHEILPPEPFPAGFRAFTMFQGARLALRQDGRLAKWEGGRWIDVPAAEGKVFRFLSRPFYWAPFLVELI